MKQIGFLMKPIMDALYLNITFQNLNSFQPFGYGSPNCTFPSTPTSSSLPPTATSTPFYIDRPPLSESKSSPKDLKSELE